MAKITITAEFVPGETGDDAELAAKYGPAGLEDRLRGFGFDAIEIEVEEGEED